MLHLNYKSRKNNKESRLDDYRISFCSLLVKCKILIQTVDCIHSNIEEYKLNTALSTSRKSQQVYLVILELLCRTQNIFTCTNEHFQRSTNFVESFFCGFGWFYNVMNGPKDLECVCLCSGSWTGCLFPQKAEWKLIRDTEEGCNSMKFPYWESLALQSLRTAWANKKELISKTKSLLIVEYEVEKMVW